MGSKGNLQEKMTHTFYHDRKVTVWVREHHTIEADTEEEAKEKFLKLYKDGELFNADTFLEEEILYDTLNYMSLEENGGVTTEELCDTNCTVFFSNEKTN